MKKELEKYNSTRGEVLANPGYLCYLIIGWEVRVSRMGPLRSGLKGATDRVGQYKTPSMRDSIRAQRGRARSALYKRVSFIERLSFTK